MRLSLLAPLCAFVVGCAERNTTSEPPIGAPFDAVLPMQVGDTYEFDSGLVVRIEAASEFSAVLGKAVRIVVEDTNGNTFGLFWELQPRQTLFRGLFDRGIDRQWLFAEDVPVLPIEGTEYEQKVPYTSSPIGGDDTSIAGQATYREMTPNASLPVILPNPFTQTVYGRVSVRQLLPFTWNIELDQAAVPLLQLQVICLVGQGITAMRLGNSDHKVVRALVGGRPFE